MPTPRDALMPPFLLQTALRLARQRGVAVAPLCRGLGFGAGDLDDPALRVSYQQVTDVLRRLQAALPDPALGLAVGASNVLGSLGQLGYAMSLSATLGDAIALALRYQDVSGGIVRAGFGQDGGQAWITAAMRFPGADPALERFAIDELFASCLVYLRTLVGSDFRPLRIDFAGASPGPAHLAACVALFGIAPRSGCSEPRLVIDRAWLARALPGHEPLALRQSLLALEQAQGASGADDLTASVQRAIARDLAAGARIETVAASLNMSGRTLRRHLAGQGRGFESLLDDLRRSRVMAAIAQPRLSLADIAESVGYSDVRCLRRAFRRWTGVSPDAWRRSAAGPDCPQKSA